MKSESTKFYKADANRKMNQVITAILSEERAVTLEEVRRESGICFVDQENLSTGLRGLGFKLKKSEFNDTQRIFTNLHMLDLKQMNLSQVRGVVGNMYSSRTLRYHLRHYKIQYKMMRGGNHGN